MPADGQTGYAPEAPPSTTPHGIDGVSALKPARGRPKGSSNKKKQALHAERAVTWTYAAVSAIQVIPVRDT